MAKETKTKTISPLYKQFCDLKAKYPENLFLFRVGDFYEAYNEDARACAEILGILLTKHRSYVDITDMAGFPYHALDVYLPKLIRAEKRISIINQDEDSTEKLVKRGITELTTPKNNNQMETTTTKQQVEGIAVETLKALNGVLPTSLNKRFADALGTLPFISLKYTHNGKIFQDEMNYLIKYAEIGLNAEKNAK